LNNPGELGYPGKNEYFCKGIKKLHSLENVHENCHKFHGSAEDAIYMQVLKSYSILVSLAAVYIRVVTQQSSPLVGSIIA